MGVNSQLVLLISALIALQSLILAHPAEEREATTIRTTQLPPVKDLIPVTPGVHEFKNDLVNQLILNFSNQNNGTYVAQKLSSEVELPCTNDTVRIEVLSSNFPLPERFFHAPKRCFEEVA